ncbi:MAG: hypothetical protein ACW98G_18195, partial [Candidatus Hodarchaeales archaeon]
NIWIAKGLYNETYENWLPTFYVTSYRNSTGHLPPSIHEVGEVIWIETDWAILCLHISAGWRQSSWKHIFLKDQNWDLVMAEFDPWAADLEPWTDAYPSWVWSRWLWSEFSYDATSWHTGGWYETNQTDQPDEVRIEKVGPVRAVIQTYSWSGYKGPYNRLQANLHAIRTFTMYNNFPGIAQNLRLGGGDELAAAQSMLELYQEPLSIDTRFYDRSMDSTSIPWAYMPDSNSFDRVYSTNIPNRAGNTMREVTGDDHHIDKMNLVTPFVGMYNNQTKNGFMFIFGDFESLDSYYYTIKWYDTELAIMYSFERFPLEGINRVLIPYSGSATNSNPENFMDELNSYWSNNYTLPVLPEKEISTLTLPTSETEGISTPTTNSSATSSSSVELTTGFLIFQSGFGSVLLLIVLSWRYNQKKK